MKQNRKFTRISFKHLVQLNFAKNSYECCVKDVSLIGMYIKGSFGPVLDTNCQVQLALKNRASVLHFSASAQVVRREKDGIAVSFTSMPSESYMTLQVLLLYNSDEPLLIGLEFPEDCPVSIDKAA
jgi:hypothetical protein